MDVSSVITIPPEILGRLDEIQPLSPAQRVNSEHGTLEGYHCLKCLDRGYIAVDREDGTLGVTPCSCLKARESIRILRASGLEDLAARCRFATYQTPDAFTRQAKQAAMRYVVDGRGQWFYISGAPGCGKTHLCTAICRRLIGRGDGTLYLLWREESPKLKALVGTDEPEYARRMDALTSARVLYIDDLFKGRISDADLNLAFSILNARYNSSVKRTIISTERPLREIRKLDPALAGRIEEKARGWVLEAPPGVKDWRHGQ